jgi:hypothetical protein
VGLAAPEHLGTLAGGQDFGERIEFNVCFHGLRIGLRRLPSKFFKSIEVVFLYVADRIRQN